MIQRSLLSKALFLFILLLAAVIAGMGPVQAQTLFEGTG